MSFNTLGQTCGEVDCAEEPSVSLQLELTAVTVDCPDPRVLAVFYQRATGWEPHPDSNAEFAALRRPDGLVVGFQRVDEYQAPRWPDPGAPQQFHLDFAVDDLEEAEAMLLGLGAHKPVEQPGGERWRVLVDPAGHPFCLTGN
jgi:predicted enzyme related to lactoylglutathione lyase